MLPLPQTNCYHGGPRFCCYYLRVLPLQYLLSCYQLQNLLNNRLNIELQHKQHTGTVRWPGKTGGAIGFALIPACRQAGFLLLFFVKKKK